MQEFVTREQLAERLGVTVSEIRRRESMGRLKPDKRGKGGQTLYRETVVQRMLTPIRPKTVKGAMEEASYRKIYTYYAADAERVFPMLRDKVPLADIVIATKLHPGVVQAILEEYVIMTGSMLISGPVMAEINNLPMDGNFPLANDEELLELLKSCGMSLCTMCKRKPQSICKGCAVVLADEEDA